MYLLDCYCTSPNSPWQPPAIMDAQCGINKFNLGSAHLVCALGRRLCTRRTSVGLSSYEAQLVGGWWLMQLLLRAGWRPAQTTICWRYASLSFQIDLCHESVFWRSVLVRRKLRRFYILIPAFVSFHASYTVSFPSHSLRLNPHLFSPLFFYLTAV